MNTCDQPKPGCTSCPSFNTPHTPCESATVPADFEVSRFVDLPKPVASLGRVGDMVRLAAKTARQDEAVRRMKR